MATSIIKIKILPEEGLTQNYICCAFEKQMKETSVNPFDPGTL